MTNTPLQGVKVVELARILAGPWIGQTLSDLGCDVIKVESPLATIRASGDRLGSIRMVKFAQHIFMPAIGAKNL